MHLNMHGLAIQLRDAPDAALSRPMRNRRTGEAEGDALPSSESSARAGAARNHNDGRARAQVMGVRVFPAQPGRAAHLASGRPERPWRLQSCCCALGWLQVGHAWPIAHGHVHAQLRSRAQAQQHSRRLRLDAAYRLPLHAGAASRAETLPVGPYPRWRRRHGPLDGAEGFAPWGWLPKESGSLASPA